MYGNGWNLSPSMWAWGSSSPKLNGFGKLSQEVSVGSFRANNGVGNGGHCSTLERLYAWEKKLYQEVKVSSSFFLSLCLEKAHIQRKAIPARPLN